jgi:hypothetical protein
MKLSVRFEKIEGGDIEFYKVIGKIVKALKDAN